MPSSLQALLLLPEKYLHSNLVKIQFFMAYFFLSCLSLMKEELNLANSSSNISHYRAMEGVGRICWYIPLGGWEFQADWVTS